MTSSPERVQDLQRMVEQWCSVQTLPEDVAELEAFAVAVSRVVGAAVVEQGLPQAGIRRGMKAAV